jgi:hypothetical protein
LDAVWAATYVAVLGSPALHPPWRSDSIVDDFMSALGDPTDERIRVAIKTADRAVSQLQKTWKKKRRGK